MTKATKNKPKEVTAVRLPHDVTALIAAKMKETRLDKTAVISAAIRAGIGKVKP